MPVHNQDSFLKIAQIAQHATTEVRCIAWFGSDIILAIFGHEVPSQVQKKQQ